VSHNIIEWAALICTKKADVMPGTRGSSVPACPPACILLLDEINRRIASHMTQSSSIS